MVNKNSSYKKVLFFTLLIPFLSTLSCSKSTIDLRKKEQPILYPSLAGYIWENINMQGNVKTTTSIIFPDTKNITNTNFNLRALCKKTVNS